MKKKHGKIHFFLIGFSIVGFLSGILSSNSSTILIFLLLLIIFIIAFRKTPTTDNCSDLERKNESIERKSCINEIKYPRYRNSLPEAIDNIDSIKNNFIAIDVETTGLSPDIDRVVEISAQHFVNAKPVEEFTTLINPGIKINKEASRVNNITNKMLKNAPVTQDAFCDFISFINNINYNSVFIAHNAKFDYQFIQSELARCGLSANMKFIDTLELSRGLFPNQSNHKLDTIREIHNINSVDAHRAKSDAIVCGLFFIKCIDFMDAKKKSMFDFFTEEDLNICKYIVSMMKSEIGENLSPFYATKDKDGVVSVSTTNELFKFRNTKRLHYILIRREYCIGKNLPVVSGNKDEFDYYRYNFNGMNELDLIKDCIIEKYKDNNKSKCSLNCYNTIDKYMNCIEFK